MARLATARLGRNWTLRHRADLRPVDIPRHIRMDACLLWRDAIPELLPAAVLLGRSPAASHSYLLIQRRIQNSCRAAGFGNTCNHVDPRKSSVIGKQARGHR